MRAILLVGHGALNKGSGASMIRLAALLKKREVVPFATAGFLNFSQPTFAEALERCVQKGAAEVIVQPYFLISGYYVHTVLPKLVNEGRTIYPDLNIHIAEAFGNHPALVTLILERVREAENNLSPEPSTALVLMAHGTPKPDANEPIYNIAEQIEAQTGYPTTVAFMECNEPNIAAANDDLVAKDMKRIINVPYFLQLGGHVRKDLPEAIANASKRHPENEIILAHHLDYSEHFLEVIRERVQEKWLVC